MTTRRRVKNGVSMKKKTSQESIDSGLHEQHPSYTQESIIKTSREQIIHVHNYTPPLLFSLFHFQSSLLTFKQHFVKILSPPQCVTALLLLLIYLTYQLTRERCMPLSRFDVSVRFSKAIFQQESVMFVWLVVFVEY